MTKFLGFGTALPEFEVTPEAGRRAMAEIWPHLAGAAMDPVTRFTAIPLEEVMRPRAVGERMRLYALEAPRLAAIAAERALEAAAIRPDQIDVVISVSCTGYMVPSLDVPLANRLGFRSDVVRMPFTELGCSGGGAALAVAHRLLLGSPDAIVLVVCAELCSLTFCPGDQSIDNLTASLVFGDGAAAAVLGRRPGGLEITQVGSVLLRDTEDMLGFEMGEGGFHPVLDRRLPRLIASRLPEAVSRFGQGPGDFQAVHAGGPRIFDAVEEGLGLSRGALSVSRAVYRRCGNISSASLLFVLAALPDQVGDGLALAFGPGITVEMAALRRLPG